MTAQAVKFDGSSTVDAVIAIDSLNIDANDRILTWRINSQVIVIKIPIA